MSEDQPGVETPPENPPRRRRRTPPPPVVTFQAPEPTVAPPPAAEAPAPPPRAPAAEAGPAPEAGEGEGRKRRRRSRGRGKGEAQAAEAEAAPAAAPAEQPAPPAEAPAKGRGAKSRKPAEEAEPEPEGEEGEGTRRRRRRRRKRGGDGEEAAAAETAPEEEETEVRGLRGSTRLEAKRQRRREGRESGRRRVSVLTEAEFLARRESVERVMVVRQGADRTQIGVLEDGVLVEHYIERANRTSSVGNVYLGRVQNVLPSMEAAFVDIGRGRNAVLYAGEVNYDASQIEGRPARIEQALKSGQSVLVQVTKDPIGHKGARLTSQISIPGRFLVFVPEGRMTGISRKLPDTERSRLKTILKAICPEDAGVIVRTAAEGASEEELTRDMARLRAQWEAIQKKAGQVSAPALVYAEPDLVLRVIRDIFNEDFGQVVVQGDTEWDNVEAYVNHVAPELASRVGRWTGDGDAFAHYRVDEQIAKALDRKVWLPSGGYLVIDRTEAMVVVDVNTGKFTGKGGNLEATVTKNNLEAAEELVRQLRLRDLGGIIVIDFIDMVLESNRELVLRRLLECLSRDRTKHQVAEVTSLGLVQMTRKRIGQGLLEAFSEPCPECGGRGVKVTVDPFQPPEVRRARRVLPMPAPAGVVAAGPGAAGESGGSAAAGAGDAAAGAGGAAAGAGDAAAGAGDAAVGAGGAAAGAGGAAVGAGDAAAGAGGAAVGAGPGAESPGAAGGPDPAAAGGPGGPDAGTGSPSAAISSTS